MPSRGERIIWHPTAENRLARIPHAQAKWRGFRSWHPYRRRYSDGCGVPTKPQLRYPYRNRLRETYCDVTADGCGKPTCHVEREMASYKRLAAVLGVILPKSDNVLLRSV